MTIRAETREVTPFTRLDFTGVGDLTLTQGESESLVIEADDEVLSEIRSEVRGDTLHIGYKPVGVLKMLFQSGKPIKMRVTMVNINEVSSSGAGTVRAPAIHAERLDLGTSGVGSITVDDVAAETLDVSISGTGSVTVAGKAREQSLCLSGVGSYRAADLHSESARITISGTGSATVWTDDKLDCSLSGVGSLEYYGNPRISQHISGIGRVRSRGAKEQ
jgi:hypothetical protein